MTQLTRFAGVFFCFCFLNSETAAETVKIKKKKKKIFLLCVNKACSWVKSTVLSSFEM